MTKTFEIKVGRDEATKTLQQILKETEGIRKEYITALDDYTAPLEKLEEKYSVQLHRMVSIAKEDPDIAREMGKMDMLIAEKDSVLKSHFRKATPVSTQKIKDYFPKLNSMGLNALFDFYQALADSRERTPIYFKPTEMDNKTVSSKRRQKQNKHGKKLSSLLFNKDLKEYYMCENKRHLMIPKLYSRPLGTKLENEVSNVDRGFFILVPAGVKVTNAEKVGVYKQALLVGTKKKADYYDNMITVKSPEPVDGILLRCKNNSKIEPPEKSSKRTTRPEILSADLNYEAESVPKLIRQFVRGTYPSGFIEQYLHKSDKFKDDITMLFALSGQKELYFKLGNMDMTVRK